MMSEVGVYVVAGVIVEDLAEEVTRPKPRR